jgi:dTDP-4-amino-4,6-dideoxygalactose transaminase
VSKMLPFTRPTLDEETIQGVAEVLRSGWLASGPKVAEFEAALSTYLGGRPVRTQTSATASMEMALLACGIGKGDEVITPAMSFVATANVIVRTGARPVFVDVGLDSRNINLDQVEAAITPRTRAVLPVHFGGLPVDMDRLYDIAKRNNLRIVEDAAHAIGSAWKGRRIGSFGDLVCFSFHPNKNITTIEGGAVSGGSPDEIKALELHRWHGQRKTPDGVDTLFAGGKANLSDVAARVGLGQLPHLEEFNSNRRQLVARYYSLWGENPPLRLPERGDEGHSWHIFAPLLPLERLKITRPQFIEAMAARDIAVGLHYPAIHLFSAYRALGYREGQFPNAERIGRETVTLPLFPTMEMSDVDRVVNAATDIIRGATR